MRFGHSLPAALMTAALLLASGIAVHADPVKIRVGWVVPVANMPSILFEKKGIAQHLGQSYVMDPVHFSGTPDMITALATGELDIGTLAYSSFALAVQNAGMSDLRVIADEFQDGAEGYYSDEFMVLNDSPIKTVEDLKGKVLAANAGGSAVDMAIRAMLRKHHMEDKKDYTLIEVGLPNMKAVLSDKKVDLISAVPPFSQDAALRGMARTLFTQKDALGRSQMLVWAARAPFLQKNRAAMVDFMEDTVRSRRFFTDPANHKEVIEIAVRVSKQPPQAFDSWLFTKNDYYRDPNDLPDLDALQANVNLQKELGFLKADLDVKKYADLSIVDEADKRLK